VKRHLEKTPLCQRASALDLNPLPACPGVRVVPHSPVMITITIANEGRFWPHYYYGPTTIRVTLASPNRPFEQTRNCRYYEVTVTEGPKFPGAKRRDIIFGCKFNPHRNTARFLKALFARLARADLPDAAPEEP
jgi:hypothetical protein